MLKNIASNEFITIVELKKAFENLLDELLGRLGAQLFDQ